MMATSFRKVAERSNALCTTAATFGSVLLTCDIGGTVETDASAATLGCGIAIAAAAIVAIARFRAVFAISVSSSYGEAENGGHNSHRKTVRHMERCWAAPLVRGYAVPVSYTPRLAGGTMPCRRR